MANLLEEVTLLAYRDDNGRNGIPYIQLSLAGAALLELTLSEHIGVEDSGRVSVVKRSPVGDPVLDDVLRRMSDTKTRHVVSSWVPILSAVELRKPVLEGLVEQRILTHERGRMLGIIPVERYHPAKAGVESEIRARLERAFSHDVGIDVRTAALAGIVSTTFMESAALPDRKYGDVHKVLGGLGKGDPAIKQVVDGIELAVNTFRSTSGSAVAAT